MNELLEKIQNILRQFGFNNLCNEVIIRDDVVLSNIAVNKIQTGRKEYFYHVSMSTILVRGEPPVVQKKTSESLEKTDSKKVYRFDKRGFYTGSENSQSLDQKEPLGYSEELDEYFTFADPVNDPIALDTTKQYKPQVFIATDSIIFSILNKSGVHDKENYGLYDGSQYLLKESDASNLDGEGRMDYTGGGQHGININGVTFYITKTKSGSVAHNGYNYGNFLWGAGANALGIPEWMAKLGAHYNNYKNDPYHKGSLDSKDDQYSIKLGYEWEYNGQLGKFIKNLLEEQRRIINQEINGTNNILLDTWSKE